MIPLKVDGLETRRLCEIFLVREHLLFGTADELEEAIRITFYYCNDLSFSTALPTQIKPIGKAMPQIVGNMRFDEKTHSWRSINPSEDDEIDASFNEYGGMRRK
jgi:hypothetical protein